VRKAGSKFCFSEFNLYRYNAAAQAQQMLTQQVLTQQVQQQVMQRALEVGRCTLNQVDP
jgi:hypothetical protein